MLRRVGVWTAVFFGVEEVVDRGRVERTYLEDWDDTAKGRSQRRKKDVASTVTAGMATSAAFSAWRECFMTEEWNDHG